MTFILGWVFLALQTVLWNELKEAGIVVANGMVPSLVYAFTWIHAAHIVMALIALVWIGWLLFRHPAKVTEIKLMNVGKFWHFLGIVWLLMYLMIFVL